jgi:hypothetical protein
MQLNSGLIADFFSMSFLHESKVRLFDYMNERKLFDFGVIRPKGNNENEKKKLNSNFLMKTKKN